MKVYLICFFVICYSVSFAQNKVSGFVFTVDNEPISGVTISVKGVDSGSISDSKGAFVLSSIKSFPWEVKFSRTGYEPQEVYITSADEKQKVFLIAESMRLNEIVVSASRTSERILESPVTIERMGISDIKKSASATFYEGLENMKEVQMNTSSLTFKSINTRGFATVANTRFMQLVDGMDNSSPLLNFVLGNMIGVSEIDVQSVELLPGASSALYGANAFNGILFMNSKSPFTNQGITGYVKYGFTSQNAAGTNDYADYGVRLAKAFNPYIAAKANITYLKGTDWHATNYQDKSFNPVNRSNPGYNGINVYGDEVSTTIINETVSRTGYNEVDLTNNKASNLKFDFGIYLRPFGNEKLEVIWLSKYGLGNAIYQGVNRYYMNDFFMEQHKLEIKGKNFFVRGYTTSEDGGNSYDMVFTGINLNRKWKSDRQWFTEYAGAYLGSLTANKTNSEAHALAREFADRDRLIPGTEAFNKAFNEVVSDGDLTKGSRLVDNSKIYHADANYNFKDLVKPVEIQVGGSFRNYHLNSFGRIYNDADGPILYNEYGIYTQLTKKIMDDRLKFTGSMRYDKSQNFNGNYSPRLSLVYSGGERRQHNFRASFQTGFRNPSTQEQYIGFNSGREVLLGSAEDNLARYNETVTFSTGGSRNLTGTEAYSNSYTASSVAAFMATGNSSVLQKSNINFVKPETVKAFDLGYRASFQKWSIDLNAYYNIYNDFLGNINVVTPFYGTVQSNPTTVSELNSITALRNGDVRVFQLNNNSTVEIKSLGFGAGLSRKLYRDFEASLNYNYAQLDFDQSKEPGFESNFNTPKHKVKVSLGNERLLKNFGFNVSGRWNTAYKWESTFMDGIIPQTTVVDAQFNYNLIKLKSTIKIGATNIGSHEYVQVLGAGLIGQQYFLSWTVNP